MSFLDRLGVTYPIIQAPMAGVSTPQLAAAVSNAGGLGSIAVGASDASGARKMVEELRGATDRAFNVNVFVHPPARPDAARESAWIAAMRPLFEEFGVQPPAELRPIYKSLVEDEAMFDALVELAPPVVSFHFGLPDADRIAALKAAGCVMLSTATTLAEARLARAAGIDAVVAQGFEGGGHRGMFDPSAPDDCLGTIALTRLLVKEAGLPVIAAGGIMDGHGIAAVLRLGAAAAQLGTAFIACPESGADQSYREALAGPAANHTVITTAISGRPARCLQNRFTDWGVRNADLPAPDYPIAYDAGKALNAAAKARGVHGYAAQWAGQGAPMMRKAPAAQLVAMLVAEMAEGEEKRTAERTIGVGGALC